MLTTGRFLLLSPHLLVADVAAWLGADVSDNSTTLTQAFLEADEVLHAGVRGISDIITVGGVDTQQQREMGSSCWAGRCAGAMLGVQRRAVPEKLSSRLRGCCMLRLSGTLQHQGQKWPASCS